jgi:hypothetical protein
MRAFRSGAFLCCVALLFAGCESPMTQSEKGALLGGAMGSGLGAIIGHKTGSTGAGIAIGGATGALAGGLIGHANDQTDSKAQEQDEQMRRQDAELARQRREIEELRRQRGDTSSGRDDYRQDPPSDRY